MSQSLDIIGKSFHCCFHKRLDLLNALNQNAQVLCHFAGSRSNGNHGFVFMELHRHLVRADLDGVVLLDGEKVDRKRFAGGNNDLRTRTERLVLHTDTGDGHRGKNGCADGRDDEDRDALALAGDADCGLFFAALRLDERCSEVGLVVPRLDRLL